MSFEVFKVLGYDHGKGFFSLYLVAKKMMGFGPGTLCLNLPSRINRIRFVIQWSVVVVSVDDDGPVEQLICRANWIM